MTAKAEKRAAARAAAMLVEDGMRVGLGTGTTVRPLLPALAERGLRLRCVATSAELKAGDGVLLADLGDGPYLRYQHEGSFDHLDESHDALFLELLAHPELEPRDSPILQEFLTDPDETPVAELRANIYVPVVTRS